MSCDVTIRSDITLLHLYVTRNNQIELHKNGMACPALIIARKSLKFIITVDRCTEDIWIIHVTITIERK